jgi:uncharacterized membrane protein required for colicin V production
MNWLLIIVLAILAVNALIGMKAGFIKTVFSLCSMVVALVLTLWLSPYANNYMRNNDTIYKSISSGVEKVLPAIEKNADKKVQENTIDKMTLPKAIKKSLIKNNKKEVYKKLSVKTFKGYLKSYLTGIVINALAFSVTFILLLLLLWVVCIALNIISKLPMLNQINKMAGLLAGAVHGLVVVWLLFILLTVFGSSEWGQKAMEMIGKDEILSMIYNNNIILRFVTNIPGILK